MGRIASFRTSAGVAALVIEIAALLIGCGNKSKSGVVTTWVYDEAVTMKHTEEAVRPALRKAVAGLAVTLVIENGKFTLDVVGGPKPVQAKGTMKAGFEGLRLHPETMDGKPVADPTGAEITLRQAERGRLEYHAGAFTVNLVQK